MIVSVISESMKAGKSSDCRRKGSRLLPREATRGKAELSLGCIALPAITRQRCRGVVNHLVAWVQPSEQY
jgi:hypothetical protein